MSIKDIENIITATHIMDSLLNGVLSQNGVIFSDNQVRNCFKHKYQTFLNKLTVRTDQRIGPPKIAKIYKYEVVGESEGATTRVIHLPRATGRILQQQGLINQLENTIPNGRVVDYDFKADLMPNQTLTVDYLVANQLSDANADAGFATVVLDMKAGLGKTFTAGGLITRLKRNTLYIVLRDKLQSQAYKDLTTCLPNNKIICANGTANAMEYADKYDIVIMIINSATNMSDNFFAKFGFVILDEIHAYCSKSRSEIFWKCQVRYVMGMSGTTNDRKDGFDVVYHKQLGVPFHADSIPGYKVEDANFKGEVKVIKYTAPDEYSQNLLSEVTGYIDFDQMLQQFMRDPYRLKLCVREILTLLTDKSCKRYIMAFSDRVEHLKAIESQLIIELGADKRHLIVVEDDDKDMVLMKGGAKSHVLDAADNARIILTTYGYSGTGVSIQHINSLVLLSPRREGFRQILPRAMRRGSDANIVRVFVDIVDVGTKIKSQFYSRKNAYESFEFAMNKVNISYLELQAPADGVQ